MCLDVALSLLASVVIPLWSINAYSACISLL